MKYLIKNSLFDYFTLILLDEAKRKKWIDEKKTVRVRFKNLIAFFVNALVDLAKYLI